MTELKMKHISIANDGSVWAASRADGTVYRLYGDAGAVGWVPDKVGKAEVIAAVNWGNAWVINKEHEIWLLSDADSLDTGGTWSKIPTFSGKADAQSISVGRDGIVWYNAVDGTIYRMYGEIGRISWVPDKLGKAVTIAAMDSGNLWCVNKDHELWRLSDAENLNDGGNWSQVTSFSGKADVQAIAVGYDGVFYTQIDGSLIQTTPPGVGVNMDYWRKVSGIHNVDVVAVNPNTYGGAWCITRDGEAWSEADGTWKHFEMQGPYANDWAYTVKAGDNLLAIVRKAFSLHDPQDTDKINDLVDRIVEQNPGITRDRINTGDKLKLNY